MASLLEGALAKAIYAGFKNKLLKGVLTRTTPGSTLDSNGDPIGVSSSTFGFEGFVENFSRYYKRPDGVPDGDVAIMIFAQSIKTVPTIEDRVVLRGVTYQLRKLVDQDPANATYRFAGYSV
jgi:hypothetical protein